MINTLQPTPPPREPIKLLLYLGPLLDLLFIPTFFAQRFGIGSLFIGSPWLILGPILLALNIISVVQQIKLVRAHQQIYKLEVLLASALTILPAVAFAAADVRGAMEFHNNLDSTPSTIGITLLLGAVMAIATLSIGNALLILGGFRRVIKVIGAVLYGIVWLGLAVICYFTYGIEYSVHDPNTE